jgi:Tol biopolymer transport system component
MAIDPMGTTVAILHVADTSGVVTAAFGSAQPPLPSGSALFLVDLATGDVTEIAGAQRGGVFWSPTGDRLLSVSLDAIDGVLWFRWQVHTLDGDLVGQSDRMLPSLTMRRSYLPFADQYAQALTMWSPDGTQFVFAGEVEGAAEGIWIQAADTDGSSQFLIDGDFAAWSPK